MMTVRSPLQPSVFPSAVLSPCLGPASLFNGSALVSIEVPEIHTIPGGVLHFSTATPYLNAFRVAGIFISSGLFLCRLVLFFFPLPMPLPWPFSLFCNFKSSRSGARGQPYRNYRKQHFFFFLAPSGELIHRDLNLRLTAVEVANASSGEAALYSQHGDNPRQPVIPRTSREVYITFGINTIFSLLWNPDLLGATPAVAQQNLALHARLLAATGMSLPAPDQESSEPSVSVYSEVVDLASGGLWAVKEIKTGARDDEWKAKFKREVEFAAPLRHVSVSLPCSWAFNRYLL